MQIHQTSLPPSRLPGRSLSQRHDIKRLCLGIAALACLANAPPEAEQAPEPAEIVGLYDGSSFETYVAMEILADGTFGWELAVGGLDLRSRGVWAERDGVIHFTTLPTPVPPEFRFVRFEARDPLPEKVLQVYVTGPRGKPFTNAVIKIECANGNEIDDFVADSGAYFDGYTPDECDRPATVTVVQSNYDIISPRYDLAAMGWQPGQAVYVDFIPNDIGVLDLTGLRGIFADGVLSVEGPLGTETLRKVSGAQELPE